MIDWMANRLAFSIKQANPENTSSIEIMKFSLILVLNTFLIIILSLIIGWASGKFMETVLTLLSFAILKFFSGGIHLKSSDNCVLWSTVGLTLLPHIPIYANWNIGLTIISIL